MHSLKRGLALAIAAAALAAPATANAAITPNPYNTASGTARLVLQSPLGTASCSISGIVATATSTATGATGTITNFTPAACTGYISGASFSTSMSFTVASGVVTLNFSVLKRNVFGGTCLYAGTFTGTTVNGSNTFTVSGTKRLIRTLAGVCEAGYPTQFQVVLPGAAITW